MTIDQATQLGFASATDKAGITLTRLGKRITFKTQAEATAYLLGFQDGWHVPTVQPDHVGTMKIQPHGSPMITQPGAASTLTSAIGIVAGGLGIAGASGSTVPAQPPHVHAGAVPDADPAGQTRAPHHG